MSVKIGASSPTMLIVDDDLAHAAALLLFGSRRGIKGMTVTSLPPTGSQVWDDIDILLFEPNLPGASWFSNFRQVERQLRLRRPRVMAVATGYPSTAMRNEARQIGIDLVVTKPYDPAAVLHALLESAPLPEPPLLSEALAWIEWEHINDVLFKCEGNMSTAARRLQIPRQTLYRKLRKQPPRLA